MRPTSPKPIVLDASVLLNFVNIGRLQLLGNIESPIVLPDQVFDEVRRPGHRKAVEDALASGIFNLQSVRDSDELALYVHLRKGGRLGAGECAVLAVAIRRRWIAGLQDRRARIEGRRLDNDLELCQTEDLVLRLIRTGDLTLDEADVFLVEWATKHRFRSRLTSFRGLLLT